MILRTSGIFALGVVLLAPAAPGLRAGDDGVVTRRYDIRRIIAAVPDCFSPPLPSGDLVFRGVDRGTEMGQGLPIVAEEESILPNPLIVSEAVVEMLGRHLARLQLGEEGIEERIHAAGGFLTIAAPAAAQEEAGRFLRGLEVMATRWIRIECLAVPPELLDSLAPAWRSSGPVLPGDAFDRALVDPRARLFTALARAGQRVFAGTKEIRHLLVEQEVNQTGVSPVNNPKIEDHGGGDLIEILAQVAPDGKTIVLEALAGAAAVTVEKTRIGEDWGDFELPVADEVQIRTAAAVPPGDAVVLASLEGRAARVILIRAAQTSVAGAAPAAGPGDEVFRIYDVSSILRRPRRSLGHPTEPRAAADPGSQDCEFVADEAEGERLDPEALQDTIRKLLGEELFDEGKLEFGYWHGCLFLGAPKAIHEKIEAFLAGEARTRIALVSVDLEFLDVPRQVLGPLAGEIERGLALTPQWRKVIDSVQGVSRRRYRIAGLPGETHTLRDATIHSLVVDSQQVSGGTGFAIITVSDPVVGTCGEGLDLSVRVDPRWDSPEALLALRGVEASEFEARPVTARFVSPNALSGVGDGEHPVPGGKVEGLRETKEIQLRLPRQKVREWNLSLDVPVDRDILLEVRAEEGEKARLLIGRVRVARLTGSP